MAQITVQQLDDHLLQLLRQRAAAAGRSMEQEARAILAEALMPSNDSFWARAAAQRARLGRELPDNVDLLRSERDARSEELADRHRAP